jgi:hypothetical protein
MTQASTTTQDVRRHPDGSIDLDFYRTRALALRGRSTRDKSTWAAACAFVLTTVSAIIVAVALASAPIHRPAGPAAVAQSVGYGPPLVAPN